LNYLNERLASLDNQRKDYGEILKAAASVRLPAPTQQQPDWTQYPFYCHTLKKYNYNYPADQFGLYFAVGTSALFIGKTFWKTWNIKKANEAKPDSLELSLHRYYSGLNDQQLKDAAKVRQFMKLRAVAISTLLLAVYNGYVQLKNKYIN
jgi:hypothetical protein